LFSFPKTTIVDRVIPKRKIITAARPSTKLNTLLTDQIQQIRWHAKLSPETVKLPATANVPEIQIIHLTLKGSKIHPDLLQLLDKAIPQPILFAIETEDQKIAYSAAHKRPSDADKSQWVVGARFTSNFTPQEKVALSALPTALDLGRLYTALLDPLLPLSARKGEKIPSLIARCDRHQALQRQIDLLTKKVNREKQFNRRVAYNQELKTLQAEADSLA